MHIDFYFTYLNKALKKERRTNFDFILKELIYKQLEMISFKNAMRVNFLF